MGQATSRLVATARLLIRPVHAADKPRFVELFADTSFMVFSECGTLDREAGADRFERMLALTRGLPFGKQAVIEARSGRIVGFVGADHIDYRGRQRLEFGYRLVEDVRDRGYATEAARALLDSAAEAHNGELLAFVDPRNLASRNVLRKLGFRYVESTSSCGQTSEVYRCTIGHSPSQSRV